MRRWMFGMLLGSAALSLSGWAQDAATPIIAESLHAASPAILLAEVYGGKTHPALYWVSEKLDGVRALWDGKALRFRSGRTIAAPAWFVAGLPPEALDGELWLGRGRFDELSGIVRKASADDAEWRQVRYMVFELPGESGTGASFTERIERLQILVRRQGLPWLQAVEQFRVVDEVALMKAFDEVVAAAGEGLMLHRADAPYVVGRSAVLQKLKPLLDAEATVVGYVAGKGRHKGRVGALQVVMADGKRLRLGSGLSDADRSDPPPVGSSVSFRYQSVSKKGIPRFPRYWRRDLL